MAREQKHYPLTPGLAALAQRPGRIAAFGVGPNLVPPSIAGLFGLRSIQGCAPMVPARTAELLACLEGPLFDLRDPRVALPLRQVDSLRHPLLDLLGVDTIVHADPTLAVRSGLPELFTSAVERFGALARPSSGPRAFWCGGARVVTDAAARLQWLADRSAAVHHTVLLEQAPPWALPERGDMRPVADVSRDDTRHELAVDAPSPGIVVLTEAWDPGWRASLDGEAAQVLVADHALMAVAVPAGRHALELRYAPAGFASAMVVAIIALAVVVIAGAWPFAAARGA
ncbi:MAG: YfhO family protein [Planctomycetota bacterium]